MVSHGLITGALFLLAGVLHERGGTYDMAAYGGLAGPRPASGAVRRRRVRLAGPARVLRVHRRVPDLHRRSPPRRCTAIAVTGILLTAALFLRALQRIFLGVTRRAGPAPSSATCRGRGVPAIVPLLVLAVVIGVVPRFLLDVIEPAARSVVELVAR